MSDSVGRADASPDVDVVADLRSTHEARADAREAVADVGRDRLVALRDALDDALRLFDRYEESATGTGDFQSYLSFQDDLVAFVEDLDDDLPEREIFEAWLDDFKKRRLSTSDFDRARRELDSVRDLAGRLESLDEATAEHRQAVAAAKRRRDELQDRIQHLERVLELGDADLDAPVEELLDPIEAYNDTIRADFRTYLRESTARDVLGLFEHAQSFPLVDANAPPNELSRYVDQHEVGEESVARLLELADFSHSKLQHFVDDPGSFKRVVGGNRTYLDALTADPFTVDWPPAEAEVLRRRIDERISLVGRFADETAIARLREIQQHTREDRFDALRDAAIAREELGADDRERLRSGAIDDDLARAREEREAVVEALREYESA